MDSYQVLYRRFRPRDFKSIVGQAPITNILRNQIRKNRVGHAYLFCGSRGTGKTSTAKVFANAINCLNPKNGEACGECEYCQASQEGGLFDVLEIDAASNRGIDEIRDLRDKVSLMPSLGRYRVYIVDEVHMLTSDAFNALLKTLEEPPSHAVFIFCTTEPSKVPATILSRCQRFDFARVPEKEMTERMEEIIKQLDVGYEKEALVFIAQYSDGAMRDALGHLEKAISSIKEGILTIESVESSMGVASSRVIAKICLSTVKGDASGALTALDEEIRKGGDLSSVFSQLIEYFRSLLIYITTQKPRDILIKTEHEFESYEEARIHVTAGRVISAVKELSRAKADSRYLQFPRFLLEATLAGIADMSMPLETESLNSRIERVEKAISRQPAAQQGYAGPESQNPEMPPEEGAPKEPAPAIEAPGPGKAPQGASMAKEPGADYTPEGIPAPELGLDAIQKEILFASRYILNKDRQLLLSNIFGQLMAISFENGVLTVAPTGDAVNMMDIFAEKGGYAKLSDILFEHAGIKAKIIAQASAPESYSIDVVDAARYMLGNLTELHDEQ